MRISDPNKLVGKVMEIKDGQGMTEIIVDVGDRPIMATITPGAAEALGLQQGDENGG
jgi:molybdopterin-binding protein